MHGVETVEGNTLFCIIYLATTIIKFCALPATKFYFCFAENFTSIIIGTCDIQPTRGVFMVTEFGMTCQDFLVPNRTKPTYSLYALIKGTGKFLEGKGEHSEYDYFTMFT